MVEPYGGRANQVPWTPSGRIKRSKKLVLTKVTPNKVNDISTVRLGAGFQGRRKWVREAIEAPYSSARHGFSLLLILLGDIQGLSRLLDEGMRLLTGVF